MMNNIPTLMQSEEARAPWKTKLVEVTVSQMLSSLVTVEVPMDFDIYNKEALENVIREQIYLPSEAINEHSQDFWSVDDFCTMV